MYILYVYQYVICSIMFPLCFWVNRINVNFAYHTNVQYIAVYMRMHRPSLG